jgi:hypothetical protein
MKARTITAPKLIAAYGLDDTKLTALAEVCDSADIKLRGVEPREADCQVGFLCGFGGFVPVPDCSEPPEGECLIFSGFDRNALSKTVDALRKNGAAVDLKAVCTPSNQSWTLRALMTELTKEHEHMTGRYGQK